jgi:uncharacterized membrane protein YuzA (DUF378 family)
MKGFNNNSMEGAAADKAASSWLYRFTFIMMCVGGINWGLVGIANLDLVAGLFGDGSLVTRSIYSVVGISSLYVSLSKLLDCLSSYS